MKSQKPSSVRYRPSSPWISCASDPGALDWLPGSPVPTQAFRYSLQTLLSGL
ncbi:hypothetical protein [Mycolicibacterium rhodesiae]|uniref:hypothetical protein n=1 Tax=Mycolicibacterium rhodesiae TaxID=36814 RepID=UPI0020A68DB8|nr:hypothetical protein [Mycolicibacterium rhodesiae]